MLKGNNNEEKIWNYLREKFTEAGTAGLMGNLRAESGLNPSNVQNSCENRVGSDTQYTQNVDNGMYKNFVHDAVGYGLAQWTYWNRKQNLLDFTHEKRLSIGDLEGQLGFLIEELSTSYKSVYKVLCETTDVRQASDIVLTQFEKPKNQGESIKNNRFKYASEYYERFVKKNTRTVKVGSARIDENGKISNGTAGDQNGKEVCMQDFYIHSKGWVVIRAKDKSVAQLIGDNMVSICNNDKIGYDQSQRTTLAREAQKYNYDASKVLVPCETDCSDAVRVCVLYAGIKVSLFNTASEKNVLEKTGYFDILPDEYGKDPEKLEYGDILVTKTKGHTVVVISGNTEPVIKKETTQIQKAQFKDKTKAGKYITTADLHIRAGASKKYARLGILPKGTSVQNYGYYNVTDGTIWLYVIANGITGYCSSNYLVR